MSAKPKRKRHDALPNGQEQSMTSRKRKKRSHEPEGEGRGKSLENRARGESHQEGVNGTVTDQIKAKVISPLLAQVDTISSVPQSFDRVLAEDNGHESYQPPRIAHEGTAIRDERNGVHPTKILKKFEELYQQEKLSRAGIDAEVGTVEEARPTLPVKSSRKQRSRQRSKPGWEISQPIGGRAVDVDPIFTEDERHLLVAYGSNINIYSIENSSMVRSLPVIVAGSADAEITSFALSPTTPEHLYVTTSQGIVYLFNWEDGQKLGRWQLNAHVWGLAVTAQISPDGLLDTVYTREQAKGKKWRISAHKLRSGSEKSKTESKTIYSSSNSILHFRLVQDGRVIVIASGQRLLLGSTDENGIVSIQDMNYTWRQLTTPNSITSFDIRTRQKKSSKSSQSSKRVPTIDIAIGQDKGVIYLYTDLLNHLIAKENGKAAADYRISSQKMHWHREAVGTVKWSLDGNYVISGGSETVLVLWQLETNRVQFLPHLGAPIERLVVSPIGTAYAIQLADNSTIVLSTSELKPKAYMGGLQVPTLRQSQLSEQKPSSSKNVDQQPSVRSVHVPIIPATTSTMNASQILIAASSSTSDDSSDSSSGRPYLQTIDMTTAHHVARQALTRTNITDLNTGPDALKITEPTLTFIKVSCDGLWLASIDEWRPPIQDVEILAMSQEDLERQANARREVFLKFWLWDSEEKQWGLVTRIENPHAFGGDPRRILDLQADPSFPGFATIGEDGAVRIWKTKSRLRGGLAVQDADGQFIEDWGCSQVVRLGRCDWLADLENTYPSASNNPITSRIAYSGDGSVLAVSQPTQHDQSLGIVHFIDAASGNIHHSQARLYNGQLLAMGFLERYLITISDYLSVWDTIQNCLAYGFTFRSTKLPAKHLAATTHLAINAPQGTFAVSLPVTNAKQPNAFTPGMLRNTSSELIVFSPNQPAPLYATSVPLVTVLLPLVGKPGYVCMDVFAELRTFNPRVGPGSSGFELINESSRSKTVKAPIRLEYIPREVENGRTKIGALILHNENDGDKEESNLQSEIQEQYPVIYRDEEDDGDFPVVRQHQVAEIFDAGPAYTLPPMKQLFEQVADLFMRKPLPRANNGSD